MNDMKPVSSKYSLLLGLAALCGLPQAKTLESIGFTPGSKGGFAVYLGGDDSELLISMTQNGAFLVQALPGIGPTVVALQNKALAGGVYGLVSVKAWDAKESLPFANNMIDFVVVEDFESLRQKGLEVSELERVLAPGGEAILLGAASSALAKNARQTASGALLKKSAEPGHYPWPNFLNGADNNALTKDNVKPITHRKWTSGDQDLPRKVEQSGFRTNNGRVCYFAGLPTGSKYNGQHGKFVCRNVYNGALHWEKGTNNGNGLLHHTYSLGKEHFYAFTHPGAHPVVMDATTGNVVHTLSHIPLTVQNNGRYRYDNFQMLLTSDEKLVIAVDNQVVVSEGPTGKEIWRFNSGAQGSRFAHLVSVSEERGVVYVPVSTSPIRAAGRWPYFSKSVDYIAALRLSDGKEIWRSGDLKGESLGQIIPFKNYLTFFSSSAIIGGAYRKPTDALIGAMNIETGRVLWKENYNPDGLLALVRFNMIVRDDVMYAIYHTFLEGYLPENGKRLGSHKATGLKYTSTSGNPNDNQRCSRMAATEDYFINGWTTWVNRKWEYSFHPVRRSSCATMGLPTYGMLLHTPQGCACYPNDLGGHGYTAYSTEGAQRVVQGEVQWTSMKGTPTSILRKPAAQGPEAVRGAVTKDWPENAPPFLAKGTVARSTPAYQTFSNSFGTITVHSSRLQLHIQGADGAQGVILTEGRVELKPIGSGKYAYVGSRDGSVYAIDMEKPELAWRFNASPGARQILNASQLESSWPISKMEIKDDQIWVEAGTSEYLSGGIVHYKLQAASGEVLERIYNAPDGQANVPMQFVPIDGNDPKRAFGEKFNLKNAISRNGDLLRIDLQNAQGELHLFDFQGRSVIPARKLGQGMHDMPISAMKPGEYIARLHTGGKYYERRIRWNGK